MNRCLSCGEVHLGTFATGKYCNRSCANKRKHSPETKLKQSLASKRNHSHKNFLTQEARQKVKKYVESITIHHAEKTCPECYKIFSSKNKIFCCRACSNKNTTEKIQHEKLFAIFKTKKWILVLNSILLDF